MDDHLRLPGRLPGTLPTILMIAASWLVMVVLVTGSHDRIMAHDAMLAGRLLPSLPTLLLFLAAWQVMTGAMMLPSSLPMIRLFAATSRNQEHPSLVLAVFLGAYFVVWTGFAVAALVADAGLHLIVDHMAWLDRHPGTITGAVLIGAGAFQFSPLKEQCLEACRSPLAFLYQHYGRGVRRAWDLGLRHGLFCLGCCWALMLVMFAVGIGSLAGMAALTGVMAIEKAFPWGHRLVPVVGVGLIGLGLIEMLPGVSLV